MTAPKKRRGRPRPAQPLSRAAVLAWLERRVNFERTVPVTTSGGTFGLARMRRLLANLGHPHRRCPVVHVAGTKGKGSVVAMLAGVLQEAGHRVGRYMSPHVHAIEERISVAGRPISSADLVRAFADVMPVVDAMDATAARGGRRGPTWFEVMTAAALVHFARARVDIAVLETGLGGRLDATNVSRPVLSIITSISLDHMQLLGSTIDKIAAEKAGIIKRGCPVISGATAPAARRVIAATAARRRAPLMQLGADFTCQVGDSHADPLAGCAVNLSIPNAKAAYSPYQLGMPGRHQADNAALVIMAARLLDEAGFSIPDRALRRGLRRVRLPARIEVVSRRPLVIVDAAHNVASMAALMETLGPALDGHRQAGAHRVLVFAASADKQIEQMLTTARGRFDQAVLTRYVTNPRSAPVDRLMAAARAAGLEAHAAATPAAALALARQIAGRTGLVCVAGSFFLAAEATA